MEKISRREFVKKSLAGAGASLGLSLLPGSRVLGANERVNVALIGCGGRGRVVARSITDQGARVATVCDLLDERMDKAAGMISQVQQTPRKEKLMGKVLDDKDIDAVIIGSPDHWHALMTIMACQAGKDVLVEKPHCHNIWESRKMIEAARKYKRIVQVGTQNRSADYLRLARDYIAGGKVGDIHLVKVFNLKPGKAFYLGKSSAPPAGFDWNQWLGVAEQRPYYENLYVDGWHHYWDFSGGDIINDGSHQVDIALLLMGDPGMPKSINSSGGKFHFKDDDSQVPDVQVVTYEFDNFVMTFEHGNYPKYMRKTTGTIRRNDELPYWTQNSTRIELYGSEEMMIVGRMGGGWVAMTQGGKVVKKQYGRFPDGPHQKNFLDCVKSRKLPNADIEILHKGCSLIHMANISYRLGKKKLWFDEKAERFVNDTGANKLLSREYRKGFEVPDKV